MKLNYKEKLCALFCINRFVDLCRVHIFFSVYALVDQKNIENNPYYLLILCAQINSQKLIKFLITRIFSSLKLYVANNDVFKCLECFNVAVTIYVNYTRASITTDIVGGHWAPFQSKNNWLFPPNFGEKFPTMNMGNNWGKKRWAWTTCWYI